jgi:hypothetical protein
MRERNRVVSCRPAILELRDMKGSCAEAGYVPCVKTERAHRWREKLCKNKWLYVN